MPTSKAQQKATNKWIAKAYDRINLTIPKGEKEVVQAHAATHGESVNGFIGRAIKETIARDSAQAPAEAAVTSPPMQESAAQPISTSAIAIADIPPEKLEQARAHAEARKESVSGFLARAIDETIERDKNAPTASQGDPEEVLQ